MGSLSPRQRLALPGVAETGRQVDVGTLGAFRRSRDRAGRPRAAGGAQDGFP